MRYQKFIVIFCLFLGVLLLASPKTARALPSGEDVGNAASQAYNSWMNVPGAGTPEEIGENACQGVNDLIHVEVLECGEGEGTSFARFKGSGLAPLTGEGLSEPLTRFRTAPDYLIGIINFALGFLGIIAFAVAIYGGSLYVTSGGSEEEAGKGKKAITYAAIGILIILASYGFVNTLLTAGLQGEPTLITDGQVITRQTGGTGSGGSGTGSRDGGGESLRSSADRRFGESNIPFSQQILYHVGAVEINAALNDFLLAYRNLIEIRRIMKRVAALHPPRTLAENRNFIQKIGDLVEKIKNKTHPLTKTHQVAARFLEDYVAKVESLTNNEFKQKYGIFDIEEPTQPPADLGIVRDNDEVAGPDFGAVRPQAASGEPANSRLAMEVAKELTERYNLLTASKKDFNLAIDSIIGPSSEPVASRPTQENVAGRLLIVWKVMGPVADATAAQAVNRELVTEEDYRRAIQGIDPNTTVAQLFRASVANLHAARNLREETTDPEGNIELLKNAIVSLQHLSIVIENIQFVEVRVSASELRGNAPFTVELRGLGSSDPSGRTIKDDQYRWDVDGDGSTDQGNPRETAGGTKGIDCGNDYRGRGATVRCTYDQPGTYRVRLAVESNDPAHIASGLGFLNINVDPPVARIALKARIGDAATQDLRKYEKDQNGRMKLILDRNEFQATVKEATGTGAGVSFDASATEAGTGKNEIKLFRWNFGDTKGTKEGKDLSRIENYLYPSEGMYPLTLEVTDTGNRTDRKLVNVAIASLVARIGTTKDIGEPDQLFEFDGGLSRSDKGSIASYEWSIAKKGADGGNILNATNQIQTAGSTDGPVLQARFKNPGIYVVKLTVSDGSQKATTSAEISITSKRPHAAFVARVCPKSCVLAGQPSLVEFDAGGSYDPDREDVLTYHWEFKNELGEELAHPTGLTLVDNANASGKDAKKIRVKFLKPGRYLVRLTVNDSHGGEIQQEDSRQREIDIASTVEAAFDSSQQTVARLEDGRAKLTFRASVTNASRARIEFGDGESDERAVDTPSETSLSFEHEYAAAGTYLVKLTASSDDGGGETMLLKRAYVSAGDAPLAVLTVSVDGNEVNLPEPSAESEPPAVEILRRQIVSFDASRSINSNGESSGLRYSFSFGDQGRATGARADHSYADISPEGEPFTVTLTVSEIAHPTKTNRTTFPILVTSAKPTVFALTAEKKTPGQITPLDVVVTAEGGRDPDGQIANYDFWYFDPADPDRKRSFIAAGKTDHATLTIETDGEADQEHEYLFCVAVRDNENNGVDCRNLFETAELPRLSVKNGPNQAPTVNFSVDHTSVRINAPITLTASGSDADGRIVSYVWDFEGDGFQNDHPVEEATVTHRYEKKSPASGYRVKLKAIDDKGAAGFSQEVPVYVTAASAPPQAKFRYRVDSSAPRRVQFFDQSQADTENGASITEWKWDFDATAEFGCDGDPTNKPSSCNGNMSDDADSTEENPTFDFPASGSYTVSLIVKDSAGNSSTPHTQIINFTIGGPTPPVSLKAELSTDPPAQFELINGERKKALHIAANSNGEPVTLFWGESRGEIANYSVDKNIWCDADGDGDRSNDVDNPDTSVGRCRVRGSGPQADHCWTTNFQRYAKTANPDGAGRFTSQLTITDPSGNVGTDTVEIIFDGATNPDRMAASGCENPAGGYGASFFERFTRQEIILMALIAGATIILSALEIGGLLKKGRRRLGKID